jgi:hypothetical protein
MSHDHAIHPVTGTTASPRPARASAALHGRQAGKASGNTDKNKDRNPWYVRCLRPIENELDVFLKNDFVWFGY